MQCFASAGVSVHIQAMLRAAFVAASAHFIIPMMDGTDDTDATLAREP